MDTVSPRGIRFFFNRIYNHPELLQDSRVKSRQSSTFWVDFQKPPKRFFHAWTQFLQHHIQPIITSSAPVKWNMNSSPTYRTTYLHSNIDNCIYTIQDGNWSKHLPRPNRRCITHSFYLKQGEILDPNPDIIESFTHIDVAHSKMGIVLLCASNINFHGPPDINIPSTSMRHKFEHLPSALKKLCGKVSLPRVGGSSLIQYLREHNRPLIGVSDASLKDDNCSHAWILTTGDPQHIRDPLMRLSGRGTVDGYGPELSSARGELQGQMALALMAKTILTTNNATYIKTNFFGDNEGVQRNVQSTRQIAFATTAVQT